MTAQEFILSKLSIANCDYFPPEMVVELLKEFALIKCAEQREICAEYAIFGAEINNILNAENPEM